MLSIWSQNFAISTLVTITSYLVILSDCQAPPKSNTNDGDYNTLHRDGSYEFGYNNNDQGGSYHISQANRANVVRGRFGSRDPATKTIKETLYTAGPRGFRARGPDIHRKMDLDQRPRGPIGNKDDPYFDPNEDPSYSFGFKTATYEKQEAANRLGDVTGRYSYVDDIGERHNVEYIAGKNTGFHVRTPFPDSNPASLGPLYYNRPLVKAEKKQRGHTAIQRGLDGSYRFVSAGPDQRRTESSDSKGNVRGSYSFLDDKGVQRTVHYIAGPGIGYRIIKKNKEPFVPSFFPSNIPDYRDPSLDKPFIPPPDDLLSNKDDGFDDLFGRPGGSAASGHVKPPANNNNNKKPSSQNGGDQFDNDNKNDLFDKDDDEQLFDNESKPSTSPPRPQRPIPGPSIDSDFSGQEEGRPTIIGDNSDDDIFGKPIDIIPPDDKGSNDDDISRPGRPGPGGASFGGDDDDDLFGPSTGDESSGNGRPGAGRPPSYGSGSGERPSGGRPPYGGARPPPYDGGSSGADRPNSGERPQYGGGGGGSDGNGDNDIFGEPEEKPSTGGRPGGGSGGNRPNSGGRPGGESGGNKPDSGGRPNTRPPSGGRPDGGSRPGYRPPGRPNGRPTVRPGDGGRPGSDSRPSTEGKPGLGSGSSSGEHSSNKPDSGESGNKKPGGGGSFLEEDDDLFGPPSKPSTDSNESGYPASKPDSGTGFRPKPGGSGFNPKPGSRPGLGGRPEGDKRPDSTSTSRPGAGSDDGSYKPSKPVGPSTDSGGSSGSGGGFLDENDDDLPGYGGQKGSEENKPGSGGGGGTQIAIGGGNKHKYGGGTIFRNIGEESINFPPGASVRAHVQSIDLLPLGSKVQSPAEAVEAELKQHGSR